MCQHYSSFKTAQSLFQDFQIVLMGFKHFRSIQIAQLLQKDFFIFDFRKISRHFSLIPLGYCPLLQSKIQLFVCKMWLLTKQRKSHSVLTYDFRLAKNIFPFEKINFYSVLVDNLRKFMQVSKNLGISFTYLDFSISLT